MESAKINQNAFHENSSTPFLLLKGQRIYTQIICIAHAIRVSNYDQNHLNHEARFFASLE